jgi:copper(I)-binding protein
MKKIVATFAIPFALFASSAYADIIISHATVRAVTKNTPATAYYMDIQNTGKEADTLESVHTSIASDTMVHNTIEENGISKMVEIQQLVIPAGKTITLKEGGIHIMAMGLSQDIKAGSSAPLTLHFTKAGEKNVSAVAK